MAKTRVDPLLTLLLENEAEWEKLKAKIAPHKKRYDELQAKMAPYEKDARKEHEAIRALLEPVGEAERIVQQLTRALGGAVKVAGMKKAMREVPKKKKK